MMATANKTIRAREGGLREKTGEARLGRLPAVLYIQIQGTKGRHFYDSRLTPSWAESHTEPWLASALPYPAKARQLWGLETARRGKQEAKSRCDPKLEKLATDCNCCNLSHLRTRLDWGGKARLNGSECWIEVEITRWATATATAALGCGLAGVAPGLLLLLLLLLLLPIERKRRGREKEARREERRGETKSGSKCWELVPLDSIDSSHQVLRHAPSRCDVPSSIIRCIHVPFPKEASERAPSGRVSLHVLLNPSPHAAWTADHEHKLWASAWPKGGQLVTVSFSSLLCSAPRCLFPLSV